MCTTPPNPQSYHPSRTLHMESSVRPTSGEFSSSQHKGTDQGRLVGFLVHQLTDITQIVSIKNYASY
uniref:Uncharacterized protein n=1 Tax=Lutzomyia longipalpis TaxID=7200 RepID=A0A1B0CMP9_LUTLO